MELKVQLLCLCLLTSATADSITDDVISLYVDAKPSHIQLRIPEVLTPEPDQSKFTTNEPYSGLFHARSECSENRTELKLGDFGTIKSPNYPQNYPANMGCEWRLEGPPGSKIQAVFFDVYTQPWFFAYFDYVMVARNGNFSNVDRMSGDMNSKTPLIVVSDENVLGVRFRSSSLFNFRGFKAQYLVVPDPKVQNEQDAPSVPELYRPVYDGICGIPSELPPEPSTTTTAEPALSSSSEGYVTSSSTVPEPEVSTGSSTPELASSASTAGVSSSSEFPIVIPSNDSFYYRRAPIDHIIGGSEAPKHGYPWMAALLIDGRHFCGGSLIDNQHIITAAHCTNKASEIKVLLGTHNIKSKPGEEESRRLYNVTRANIFQHPEYNENTISHDITVLKLPEKVEFTDQIRPICVPNRKDIVRFFTDDKVRVTGWGKPADNSPSVSPVLKVADVKVMPNSQCRYMFRGIITGNIVCVETTREASPCKGDSGGPLMYKEVDPVTGQEYYMLTGIVSFGSLTCERALPVGFTRVTAFLDYISEVTGKEI